MNIKIKRDAPTLEGQYIIKNIVLVSAGLVIGATVRADGLSPIQKADAYQPLTLFRFHFQ